MDHIAEVVDRDTGKVLKTFGPMSEREARALADGAPYDERFYTRAVPVEPTRVTAGGSWGGGYR